MRSFRSRLAVFLALLAAASFLLWSPLRALVDLAWKDERYTYMLAVPVLSASLILVKRQRILALMETDLRAGAVGGVLSLIAWFLAGRSVQSLGPVDGLCLHGVAISLAWIAGFGLCFGRAAVKAAAFPLSFLLLMTPAPESFMHAAEVGLQYGSADVTHVLMRSMGMPVFREGLTFSLPGLNIQVAEECSGIRSSTVFWITTAAASYLFLGSGWSRLALLALTVPILIFKNAVRITTLSWLGVNVSRDVLEGELHRQGGVPFGLIAIAMLVPAIAGMRKLEGWMKRKRSVTA